MATTILTAKKAAREHRGRVLSSFFQQRLPDGQKTTNISLSAIRGWEADLNCQRRAILSTLDNLLPIEGGRREPLQEHLEAIDGLLNALKPRSHRYPILSIEPLKWRDRVGYPKLVIMALNQPGYVEIAAENNGSRRGWHYLPLGSGMGYEGVMKNVVNRCYRDVGAKLQAKCNEVVTVGGNYNRHFIRMELGELLIPTKTRKKIAKAREFFGDQLFLVAEAGKWVEGRVTLPKPDPLIVGYEDGLLFLIDVFDLKRIEDIARSEFVVPQPSLPLP